MANWGDLIPDVLVEIARRIKYYQDFVAFRQVCRSWKSAAVIDNFRNKCNQIPWLMLPPNKQTNLCDFFNPCPSNTTSTNIRQLKLPTIHGKKCFSSKGWILMVDPDWSISLLNPFSSTLSIRLPHIKTFNNWLDSYGNLLKMNLLFINKFFLSSTPLSEDYVIMVIYGDRGQLAYYKPGDKAWTTIHTWHGCYLDITYHNRQFYAINCRGTIMACNVEGDNPTEAKIVAQLPSTVLVRDECEYSYYLIESTSPGLLLIVTREIRRSRCSHTTLGFQVSEVDLNTNTWTEIKDLGNRALFVGHNSSFSIQVSDVSYCNPNSIYFTDDYWENYLSQRRGGGKDAGIYNLKDGTVIPNFRSNFLSRLCPPMWVEQSFK